MFGLMKPGQNLGRMETELDRLFEGFLRDPFAAFGEPFRALAGWDPKLDVVEGENEVTVRAELPGVDPKDVDLTLSGNVLTISAERKEELEQRTGQAVQSERRHGSFRRSFILPQGADPEKVSAEYAKGVLTVKIGKDPKTPSRHIPISTK